jgi:hypothetical protein
MMVSQCNRKRENKKEVGLQAQAQDQTSIDYCKMDHPQIIAYAESENEPHVIS